MADQLPRTPYHIGEQNAAALLAPIALDLERIEARLAHFVERLRMPEAEREKVARARDVLARARRELAS